MKCKKNIEKEDENVEEETIASSECLCSVSTRILSFVPTTIAFLVPSIIFYFVFCQYFFVLFPPEFCSSFRFLTSFVFYFNYRHCSSFSLKK